MTKHHIAHRIIADSQTKKYTTNELMYHLINNEGLTFYEAAGAIGFAVSHQEIFKSYAKSGVKCYII